MSWKPELSWTFPPRAALDDPARRDLNPQLDAAASTGYGGQRRAPACSSGMRRDQSQRRDETRNQRRDETRKPDDRAVPSISSLSCRRGQGGTCLTSPHPSFTGGNRSSLQDWLGGVSGRLDPPPPKRLCFSWSSLEAHWLKNDAYPYLAPGQNETLRERTKSTDNAESRVSGWSEGGVVVVISVKILSIK